MNVNLQVWQVKDARQRVHEGEGVAEVAQRHGVQYNVIYNAVLGNTWSSISNPPPVEKGVLWERDRKRPWRTCGNCGLLYQKGGTSQRCGGCYAHLLRHGVERTEAHLHQGKHSRLSEEELMALYEKYKSGESLSKIANTLPFSDETLRRRFKTAGFSLRNNGGKRVRLTPQKVRRARGLHYQDGMRVKDISELMGIGYNTIYSAITGATWADVGGLPVDASGKSYKTYEKESVAEVGLQIDKNCPKCGKKLYTEGTAVWCNGVEGRGRGMKAACGYYKEAAVQT